MDLPICNGIPFGFAEAHQKKHILTPECATILTIKRRGYSWEDCD